MAVERGQNGPSRTFDIDKDRRAKIVLGTPHDTPLHSDVPQSSYPGIVEVHRRKDGKVLEKVEIEDASFAIFGIHEEDMEIKTIKDQLTGK